MKTTHINPAKNADGSQNVSFLSDREGWMPAGRLMPAPTNVKPDQPASLAKKLVQARIDRTRRTMYHA